MNNNLEIKKLTIRQIIVVYSRSLKKEFPANERRPLFMIIKGVLAGNYECLGAFYKGRLLAYAFFLKNRNDYLLDYLAVFKRYRCKGVGTKVIQAIRKYYKDADSIIGEVENPDYADNGEDSERMKRRLDFYLKNACIDTGVRTITFGAHFIIIQLFGKQQSQADMAQIYQRHYKDYFPQRVYEKNVFIGNTL